MIESELLFLGILKKKPKHGYEIKGELKKHVTHFVNVDTTSIYYPLSQLAKKGFISKKTAQAGKRPEKYIYQLTAKGEERFIHLLEQSLVTLERPFFNLDLALYFSSYLRPQILKRKLRIRLKLFNKLQKQLERLQQNLKSCDINLLNIVNHDTSLLKAEIDSVSRILHNLK